MADLDIAAFLRARLDEREARARSWERLEQPREDHDPGECDECDKARRRISNAVDHADFDDPQFVLADVAAKRQILAMHKRTATGAGDRLIEHCSCQDDWSTIFGRYWPCDTLSLLALPYAGHPDYREEWKP